MGGRMTNTGRGYAYASKRQRVLWHLQGSERLNMPPRTLTPKEANDLFDTMRLGAIIFDLRQEGHPIGDLNLKPGGGRYAPHSNYFYDRS